jgi:hypothetical protein
MAKQILNKMMDKFVSKKLFCLLVGIVLTVTGIGVDTNLLYLMATYIGSQAVIDSVSAFKQ